jgi:Cu+-exporting ATPase
MGIFDFFKTKKGEQATDPVCGMKISKKEAKFSFEYEGKTYYFCSASCQSQFEAEPRGYVGE